jgi:D-ribose pyranase
MGGLKMKKGGILNPQLNRVISEMGHRDILIIADAGLPIPQEIERIDLALKSGIPYSNFRSDILNDLALK